MEIRGVDGIRGVDNNSRINRVTKKSDGEARNLSDSAEISTEAKQRLEEEKLNSIMKNTPDVREDRITEVREKLSRGDYNKEEVINVVAERIMKALGL
ncbi:MAG: flagellar biosynthesis anti-sigma factor FlgM [Brevinematia bacterium]